MGSGTGISSELFLRYGCEVWAVEPNDAMRAAAETWLGRRCEFTLRFHSVGGSAEATGLAEGSVDLVTAGQAFHWFDPERARAEFRRILRPERGWVALMWNDRRLIGSPFLEGYEELLLAYQTDYTRVRHDNLTADDFARFFGPGGYESGAFPNSQRLDRQGLRGRLLSASYTPQPGQPGHDELLAAADRLFDRCHVRSIVTLEYDTRVYLGRLM